LGYLSYEMKNAPRVSPEWNQLTKYPNVAVQCPEFRKEIRRYKLDNSTRQRFHKECEIDK